MAVTRTQRIKLGLTLTSLVAGLILIFTFKAILASPAPVSGGEDRGLVIFSTEPNQWPNDLDLHVKQQYSNDGRIRMLFFIESDGASYNQADSKSTAIDYSIAFVGERFKNVDMTCGGRDVPRVAYNNLSLGQKTAISSDIGSTATSATNYLGSRNATELSGNLEEQTQGLISGSVWITPKGETHQMERRVIGEAGNEEIFIEECSTTDAAAAWDIEPGSSLTDSPQTTLLPYQVNWVSEDNDSRHLNDLVSWFSIDREPKWTLTEAYPEVTASDFSWEGSNTTLRYGDVDAENSFLYSNQPVLIFADRGADEKATIQILWLGVLLGFVGSLAASSVSQAVDALS